MTHGHWMSTSKGLCLPAAAKTLETHGAPVYICFVLPMKVAQWLWIKMEAPVLIVHEWGHLESTRKTGFIAQLSNKFLTQRGTHLH